MGVRGILLAGFCSVPCTTPLRKEGLTMMLKGAKMARLGSARLGSARLGSSIAPFFQCVKPSFRNFSKKRISITFLTNIDIIADSPKTTSSVQNIVDHYSKRITSSIALSNCRSIGIIEFVIPSKSHCFLWYTEVSTKTASILSFIFFPPPHKMSGFQITITKCFPINTNNNISSNHTLP